MWVRLFRGRLPRLFTNSFNSRTRVGATSHHRPAGLPHEVSIHAPVWVRQEGLSSMSSYEGFQFTHPCGCDSVGPVRQGRGMGFNSRTRVGATPADELATSIYTVSIHAPVWVRPYMTELSFWFRRFQFTHPCGCDCGLVTVESVDKVSIHAPVWVRPSGMRLGYVKRWVSIHAPVWVRLKSGFGTYFFLRFQFTHPCGCDMNKVYRMKRTQMFQFTHPCGCDCGLVTVESVDKVSIHAPVWVRRKPFFGTTVRISFNSRTRVGATMDVV